MYTISQYTASYSDYVPPTYHATFHIVIFILLIFILPFSVSFSWLTHVDFFFCLIQYFDKWSMKIDDSKTSLQKNRTFIIHWIRSCIDVHISRLRPFLSHFLSSYIPHLSACDDDCDNKQIIIFCVVLCCGWMCTYIRLASFFFNIRQESWKGKMESDFMISTTETERKFCAPFKINIVRFLPINILYDSVYFLYFLYHIYADILCLFHSFSWRAFPLSLYFIFVLNFSFLSGLFLVLYSHSKIM